MPRSRIGKAKVTPVETGIRIWINEVDYTGYAINYRFTKKDNQVQDFEIDLVSIEESERGDVAENKVVWFVSQNKLIFHGLIERVEYSTGEFSTVRGFGTGESKLKAKIADLTASSDVTSSSKRPIYSDTSINTIASEQLAGTGVNLDVADNGVDLGSGTYRGDHTSKLSILAGGVRSKYGKWWFSYGPSLHWSTPFFHVASTRGSASSVRSYRISGVEQNADATSNESDFENLYNNLDVLGFGDGLNQKTSVIYHATDNRSKLSGDILSGVTTIALDDASTLPASGNAWIGVEEISYGGKSGNDLTGVIRGIANSVDNISGAYAHSQGVMVWDSQYTVNVPESSSSIDSFGERYRAFQDKTIIDQDALDRIATDLLEDHRELVQRIVVIPSDPYDAVRAVDVGDMVTIVDSDANLNGEFRVYSVTMRSNEGFEFCELECGNGKSVLTEELEANKALSEIESKYMQGATNVFIVNETENAEAGTTAPGPIDIFFEIPSDAVAINEVKLAYRNEEPRTWNDVSSSNSEATEEAQGSAGDVTISNNTDWQDVITLSQSDSEFSVVYAHLWIDSIGSEAQAVSYSNSVQFRVNNTTDSEIYGANSNTKFITGFEHKHEESGGGDTLNVVASDVNLFQHNGPTAVIVVPKSTQGRTVKLQAKLVTTISPTPDNITITHGYQSVSTHTHDITYNISGQQYTTSAINIYTTDDATSTPIWTNRSATLSGVLARPLNASDEENETDLDLTPFFGATGWKGIRIVTDGNSRHKAQVKVKCFVESKKAT